MIPDGRDADDALDGFVDFSDGYQATAARDAVVSSPSGGSDARGRVVPLRAGSA